MGAGSFGMPCIDDLDYLWPHSRVVKRYHKGLWNLYSRFESWPASHLLPFRVHITFDLVTIHRWASPGRRRPGEPDSDCLTHRKETDFPQCNLIIQRKPPRVA
jgi:hypothetical protein